MKHQNEFSQKQEHIEEHRTQAGKAQEFSSSDELLRFDAAQTIVPPEIARRLQRSAAEVRPPAARSWWKNIFGG